MNKAFDNAIFTCLYYIISTSHSYFFKKIRIFNTTIKTTIMSISDLFDNEFKSRNKGHFSAIVRVALADGNATTRPH